MECTKEEHNVKLYPIYKMFSWDLLFYYSISFIFLTQIKGFSASNILLGEAFYHICKIISQVPLIALIRKLGKRKSLIFANIINAFSVLCCIIAKNIAYIFLAQFFSAIAFNTKGLVESNLLYDCLPKNEKRGHAFSRIDGKGNSLYYYTEAIAAVLSGFLYIINGYIPFILCFICCLISVGISVAFKETEKDKIQQHTTTTKEYLKDLQKSFKYMLQSDRLKYLFVFGAIFSAVLTVLVSPRSSILKQIGLPEQYFGVVFAGLGIISGISAKNQNKIHNKYRNKTLSVLSIPTTISCIIIGFWVSGNFSFVTTLVVILALYIIQDISKGAFHTLIKRYLNNFTNSNWRNKIISAYNFIENIAKGVLALIAAWLLKITNGANVVLIIGCISTIAIVLLLDSMRNKVGLKPEEYKKEDIEFLEIQ